MGYVRLGQLPARRRARVMPRGRACLSGYVTEENLSDLGFNLFKSIGKGVKKVGHVLKKVIKPALFIGGSFLIPGVGPLVGKFAGGALKAGIGLAKGTLGAKGILAGAKQLAVSKALQAVPLPRSVSLSLPMDTAPIAFAPSAASPSLPVQSLQQAAAAPFVSVEPRPATPASVSVDASAPVATGGGAGMPGWVIPAAIGVGALLLVSANRPKRRS